MSPSPKKETSTGKAKGRVSSRRSDGNRPSPRTPRKTARPKTNGLLSQIPKPHFLPFVAIWLLAVAVLAGLVYWGESNKPLNVKARAKHRPAYASSENDKLQRRGPVQATNNSSRPNPVTAPPSPLAGTQRAPESQKASLSNESPAGKPDGRLTVALSAPANGSPLVAPPVPQPPSPALPPSAARVAIVIDDFGLDLEVAGRFLALPYPITVSILPYLRHSREVAELAHSHNHEVILHVPMEPHGFPKVDPGPGALLLSMSDPQIEQTLETALDSCPYLAGINNHMGSKFTEKTPQMRVVLRELNRRGLYFLDSETSPNSVAFPLARELSIPSIRRDIFLDHTDSEEAITSQILQLIKKAKIQGSAIAIGHPHDSTLKVLMRSADLFQKEGVTVVPASHLISSTNIGSR